MKRIKRYSVFVVLAFLLSVVAYLSLNKGTIHASEDKYSISVGAMKDEVNPIMIELKNVEDEMFIVDFQHTDPVSEEALLASVNKDFSGKVTVTDLDEGQKQVTVTDGNGQESLIFSLNVGGYGDSRIVLKDMKNNILSQAAYSFDDKLVAPPTQTLTAYRTNERIALRNSKSHDLPTQDEIDAANDAANARFGFDPTVKIATVSNWLDFYTAYNTADVTKIVLLNNIQKDTSGSSNLNARSTSIEIDGQGYTLNLSRGTTGTTETLELADNGTAFFHMHDIKITQYISRGSLAAGGDTDAFIGGTGGYASREVLSGRANFAFRFGNVTTITESKGSSGSNWGIHRLLRAGRAEVTMYGDNSIESASENFYLGSLIVEEKTRYFGEIYSNNYSVVWYRTSATYSSSNATDTGASEEATMKKNSFVYLKNTNASSYRYPGLYANVKDIVLEEGSTYSTNFPGNAVSLYREGASLRIKNGATGNFLTYENSAVIQFANKDTNVTVEPGGNIYVSGNVDNGTSATSSNSSSRLGLIDFVGSDYTQEGQAPYSNIASNTTNNRTFIMNSPGSYDFNNKFNNTANYRSRVLELQDDRGLKFEITDTDVDIWNTNILSTSPSSFSYSKVASFSIEGASSSKISSSNSALQANFTSPNNFRRISGFNVPPTIEWFPVTDADKGYKVRILVGNMPDSFDSVSGEIIYVPVYAGVDQVQVTFTDSRGNTVGPIGTDANGYVEVTNADGDFNLADQDIKASAVRGPWVSELTTNVIDITPPEPAELIAGKITNATKQLIAENLEANAKVFLTISGTTANAGTLVPAGTVGADGKWTHNLSEYLNSGDSVTIYLQDNAGEAVAGSNDTHELLPAAPSTNSVNGNINPYPNDLNYRDATFKKAANYVVEDVIPDDPSLTKSVISSGGTTTSVGDTLTYTLTGRNNKADSEDWGDVVLEDTLPEGLDFDANNHGITIKKVNALGVETEVPLETDSFEYNTTTRLLKIKVGNVPTMNGFIATFKVTVNNSKIGQDIENSADAKGFSPQEDKSPFVPGPIDPTGPFKPINVTTANPVGVPGGVIHGILKLTSAPKVINFKEHAVTMKDTRVEEPELSAPLTVSDNRGNRESWTLTATLTKEMAHANDSSKVLSDAIKFNNGSTEKELDGFATVIKTHTHDSAGDYVVSNDWSSGGTGIKLEVPVGSVKKLGQYQAEITWHLGDTP
ncbi:WxL domain-containing protein [Candidatus Enterococcus clewellii]|uniref:WxL domain-containing protein n=1 Tax=Candidatus Enterococcus clewellii TaxID=1834193 RepID=A0A242K1L7_9ENTE|nr:WxL domain-containing protein [Enterococcus sp. 9E7_DIV0242]OTP11548.1 hypothetical protein A5888_003647 [Enterococcus sp. 9E7_DIV0242]